MKINELVKQLNALKKQHGNIDVSVVDSETGYSQLVLSISTAHPLNSMGCYDRSKPAYTLLLNTYRR